MSRKERRRKGRKEEKIQHRRKREMEGKKEKRLVETRMEGRGREIKR